MTRKLAQLLRALAYLVDGPERCSPGPVVNHLHVHESSGTDAAQIVAAFESALRSR